MRPNLSHSLPTNPEKQRQESKSGSSKETLTKDQKTRKISVLKDKRGNSMIKHVNRWEMAEKVKSALYMSKDFLERR